MMMRSTDVLEEWKDDCRDFLTEEDGVGVVEIILILVVLISLVVLFKDQLTSVVGKILNKVASESGKI